MRGSVSAETAVATAVGVLIAAALGCFLLGLSAVFRVLGI